jgi:hypothetical protein
MTYEVLTFIGDFPITGQPNWNERFDILEDAIKAAKEQHEQFKIEENNEHYTIIVDLEKEDDDDIVWIIYQDQEQIGLSAKELADRLTYGELP